MKHAYSLALWCMLTAALAGLYRLADHAPSASADGDRPLVLLTEDGPRTMTMAEYLPFALAAEMPVSFGDEALKAQAVAIRTLALAGPRHPDADLCADAGCCVAWLDEPALRRRWGADYEANIAVLRRAVATTDGEYLAYAGEPIQAAFHAASLGRTEDSGALWASLPYLVSVSSPETARDAPELVSSVTVAADELALALDLDTDAPPEMWVEQLVPDGAGRVDRAVIAGKEYAGRDLRGLFGLRSTAFDLAWDGEAFVFTVSGYGHGVGMSQYGARAFAAQGMDYEQILAHYYPGTELVSPAGQSASGWPTKNISTPAVAASRPASSNSSTVAKAMFLPWRTTLARAVMYSPPAGRR